MVGFRQSILFFAGEVALMQRLTSLCLTVRGELTEAPTFVLTFAGDPFTQCLLIINAQYETNMLKLDNNHPFTYPDVVF